MANGILIAVMDFSGAAADEFHDWYDAEHVPERLRVPGFLNAERWIGAHDPKISVATYDLTSPEVLDSPAYRAVGYENSSPWTKRVTAKVERLMRFAGEQILPGQEIAPTGAGALLLNAMNVAPECEAEFNEWYDTEHVPALAAVPGTLSARRFRSDEPGVRRYVALYHLASPEVPDGAAWKKAAGTPWTEKLRPYFRDHLRIVSRRYVRAD
jgi:hypothetical protein